MRTGLDVQSEAENWIKMQRSLVELEDLKWHLIWINLYYLMWDELILIQSTKDWINSDQVLGLDQYTSPGIQYREK
jgi:hypothetical protein